MLDEKGTQLFFRCRTCGQSMSDDESIWVVSVNWPTRIKVTADGQLAYQVAELSDEDVIHRLDASDVVCDACHGNDVEIKEMRDQEN